MSTYGAIRKRYEPRAVVGTGAQGEVLCARDLVHDRLVALKVRHIGAGTDREELLAEARTLLNLRPHPGVALVREDFFVGDRYHMVMDWIDGVDLSRLLAEAGPAGLAFQRLLGYLTQVADAVDHLHRHDPPIVHKDVKPANIVVDASGRAVLVDFGISTGTRGLQSWSGTSGYVAPEIAAGEPGGPASDIFSLAATAYFAFTGVSPEPGARPGWRGVPEALVTRVEGALARGLALDPARRPPTARALVELLAPPSVAHNLPAALTRFVGRQRELAHLARTLDRTRLLSLVGSGGMGKTRLATELASEVAWAYPEGVWLVELAPVGADFVTAAVAKVLGVREAPGRTLLEAVADRLRDRHLLVVLDNCEHVLDAAAGVAETLLQGAPGLRILATSRQPLDVFGEVVHRVSMLSFPDAAVSQTLEQLASYEAVELFCGRAHAADPSFALGPETAGDVTEVCAVLDGTPLALEMAASRLRELSLPELAGSLGDALELRGARTAPSRQRTLAATVAWSYDLLPASAAALFRRLSVFAGTFSMEAAQAVCGGAGVVPTDVPGLLRSLVERSMVVPEPGGESPGERHRLLETLRLYGQELSIDAGEHPWLVDHHVEYFLSLVDDAHGRLFGAEEADTLNKLDTETANFRLALGRALEDGQGEKALRLAIGLSRLWKVHGPTAEGGRWLEASLAATPEAPGRLRAKALAASAVLSLNEGGFLAGTAFAEHALKLARAEGDDVTSAEALGCLHDLARAQGELERAESLLEESLTAWRKSGEIRGVVSSFAGALGSRGDSTVARGLLGEATALYQEALTVATELGIDRARAGSLYGLCVAAEAQGDLAAADRFLSESTVLYERLRDVRPLDYGVFMRSLIAFDEGDLDEAMTGFLAAMARAATRGDRTLSIRALEGIGRVVTEQGDLERATALFGAAAARREAAPWPVPLVDRPWYDAVMAQLRNGLGDLAFETAWNDGRAISAEDLTVLVSECSAPGDGSLIRDSSADR